MHLVNQPLYYGVATAHELKLVIEPLMDDSPNNILHHVMDNDHWWCSRRATCGLRVLQRQLDEVLPQLLVRLRLHEGDGRRHVRQAPDDELQRAPRGAHAPQHVHLRPQQGGPQRRRLCEARVVAVSC